MDYRDRLDLVRAIERECPVNDWRLGGIRMWPFIVFEIHKAVAPGATQTDRQSSPILSTLKFAWRELGALLGYQLRSMQDRRHNGDRNQRSEVVLLTQATRRTRLGNVYYDRVCDPYVDALKALDRSWTVLEWTYGHKYRTPRANSSVLIQHEIDLVIAKSLLRRRCAGACQTFASFERLLELVHRQGIDPVRFRRQLETDMAATFALRDYFKKLYGRLQARLVLTYPWYGIIGFAAVLACRELGIKSADIQHGFYADTALLYNGFREMPPGGYELAPDLFWCWESRDSVAISKWGHSVFEHHRPFVGGNLWLNIWLNPSAHDNQLVDELIGRVEHRKQASALWRHVLVTFSPFYQAEAEWLADAIHRTAGDTMWWIRFHHHTCQADIQRFRDALAGSTNLEYELANELPLPSLLSALDVHVTVESSCAEEAKAFGVTTAVISQQGAEIHSELIRDGWARSALTAEEVLSFIEEHGSKPREFKASSASVNAEIVRAFLEACFHEGSEQGKR